MSVNVALDSAVLFNRIAAIGLVIDQMLELAASGAELSAIHVGVVGKCPLSGVKRTS